MKWLCLLIALWCLVAVVVAESEYCDPSSEFTVTYTHEGDWFNFTIESPNCWVCVDNGAGYGDVSCTMCSENAPVAGIRTNATCAIVPGSILFTDWSAGTITDYYWDFGDGENSTLADVAHEYTATGIYNVSHYVNNSFGSDWENKSYLISIRPVGDVCESSITVIGDDDLTIPIIGIVGFAIVGILMLGVMRR